MGMGQVRIQGTLAGRNDDGCSGGTRVDSQFDFVRSFEVASGLVERTIDSEVAWVPLSTLGASTDVGEADVFYFEGTSALELRLTFETAGAPSVVVIPCFGLFTIATPPDRRIIAADVRGVGRFTYFASKTAE